MCQLYLKYIYVCVCAGGRCVSVTFSLHGLWPQACTFLPGEGLPLEWGVGVGPLQGHVTEPPCYKNVRRGSESPGAVLPQGWAPVLGCLPEVGGRQWAFQPPSPAQHSATPSGPRLRASEAQRARGRGQASPTSWPQGDRGSESPTAMPSGAWDGFQRSPGHSAWFEDMC